ncbi:RdgB/HAM1 family non-canonical purine NTP pyrophosphatase [Candidatus Profftia sp. (ex Adelges kitamiensis)]|uniref:RdgB/HAM1 family non-canonical purine NTP pyrophosphatase n=1 Tax=Candidatus Profftia sp. (ex Adelges kitamiensis) TaxID=2864218 RepID=UPI001CE3B175|nr:RdgB/HAM1 family non-canonical purine NTP pyrophosphatase [Candidatus Profftia sp. (ex Adelges kitamiensis)]
MNKIVLATKNLGKVHELTNILTNFNLNIITQDELGVDSIEETGLTFIENAIIKARHVTQITGLPTIAEDSGLTVDALRGAPGIYSARYAGGDKISDRQNLKKLLVNLQDVPKGKRQAKFHCIIVYLCDAKNPTPLVCHGIWLGEIGFKPLGKNGFGYDSVFYPANLDCSAAQLTREHKMKISHRGQAIKLLLEAMHNA